MHYLSTVFYMMMVGMNKQGVRMIGDIFKAKEYKDNKKLLKYLLTIIKNSGYPILKVKDIVKLITITDNIKLTPKLTPLNVSVMVKNNSLLDVNNFTFRVYTKYPISYIESDFLNIETDIIKRGENYVDVRIKKLPKDIILTLFLRLKK